MSRLQSQVSVLLVDHGLAFGGTVVVASALLRALDTNRYRATFVTAADSEFVKRRVPPNASIVLLTPKLTYRDVARLREMARNRFGARLARVSGYVITVLESVANVPYLLRLAILIRTERVRVIHCNNGLGNIEAVLLGALFRIPVLHHVHGLAERRSRFGEWIVRRRRSPTIAVSEAVRKSLVFHGFDAARVRTVYNPVEPVQAPVGGRRRFRESAGIPQEATLIGLVGRVVRWKGQLEFLKAGVRALAACSEAHLAIIGDASDGEQAYVRELVDFVEASGLADRVHFVGFVLDTPSMYASLDLLVHASIAPEPFGLVLTEAMVQGIPVIAASSGAPLEIVEEGVTGILRDPADECALADAMIMLCKDPDLRRTLGERARASVLQRFDAGRFARSVEAVYDELLSS